MDQSNATAKALASLNALHAQFMTLLTDTLDAAEDGVSPLEGVALSVSYVQAGVTILHALKTLAPEVRAQLRVIAPKTRFVATVEGP